MSIAELKILLDLNCGNEVDVLKEHASLARHSYFFVDSENGQCYLFDKNGKIDDIKKIKTLLYGYFKTDIKKIIIPESVKSIGDSAFYNCMSLTSIEITEGVKSIGVGAFENCISLQSVKIPKSVESIGDSAFYNCISLKSIEIPEGVKSIRVGAFVYCTSLEEVIFKGKTMDQVKAMDEYPWGIKDESIIKSS